jgi:glycosyltransferase involved in cell wall biosynthesis
MRLTGMNKTMNTIYKIMMIEPLGDGGIAHYSFNLLNALIKKGERVQLVTAKNYEFENNRLTTFKVSNKMFRIVSYLVKRFPWIDKETRIPSIVRRIIKLIEYPINVIELLYGIIIEKIDIVHFQSVNLIELIAVIGSRMIGGKVVFTIHNVMPRHQKLYLYHKFIYRMMYSLCHKIIIHSEKGKEEIIDLYKVSSEKIHVIPHGDYKFFIPEKQISKAEAKSILGFTEDVKTILFFGAIRPNKGLKDILLALPYIKEQVSNVMLMIVGEMMENYNSYREVIVEKQIRNEVFEKLDYVPNEDVAFYFFAADLVVLPYKEITQSGILQIAYAFGKPVVATDLGGFREAIEDGQNGYLVPLNNIQVLAERCVEILTDKEKLKKMGDYSRLLSDNKFSWDSIADKTIEVYKRCIAE